MRSWCACHTRQAVERESPQQPACSGGQIAGQICWYGLACLHDLCIKHVVGPREAELDSPDESSPAFSLELPDQKRRRQPGEVRVKKLCTKGIYDSSRCARSDSGGVAFTFSADGNVHER